MYVFAYDLTCIMLANSCKQNLVGQNVRDVPDTVRKKIPSGDGGGKGFRLG